LSALTLSGVGLLYLQQGILRPLERILIKFHAFLLQPANAMKSKDVSFFEYTQTETAFPVEPDPTLIRHFGMFASIIKASCYILDIRNRRFCYIHPNDLFLFFFSVEEALTMGYGFTRN
jgi:Na+-translocating ferredoxin:NAD+ oxidoreductase RnfA subunit